MDRRIRQLRKRVDRCRQVGGRRPRYGDEIRSEALDLAAQLSGDGLSHYAIAKRLGLNAITLASWKKRRDEMDRQGPAGMLPVAVVAGEPVAEDFAGRRLMVFGPGGVRVEGLDVDGVAELLRKLS